MLTTELAWQWICNNMQEILTRKMDPETPFHIPHSPKIRATVDDTAESKKGENPRNAWTSMIMEKIFGWDKNFVGMYEHTFQQQKTQEEL